MIAAEHIERQVAIAVVVAVEEAALLMAVQRIVGGVEIEDDLPRRLKVRIEKEIDQKLLDGRGLMADLVVARGLRPAQLQPVERALARHRRAVLAPRRELAGQHRHHRVVAQLVMIIEVLVAQRDPEHPLAHQGRHLVLDQLLPPRVPEAAGEALDELDRTIRRTQQQCPGIRRDGAPVERRHHRTSFYRCKIKPIRNTLCRHRGAPLSLRSPSRKRTFADSTP